MNICFMAFSFQVDVVKLSMVSVNLKLLHPNSVLYWANETYFLLQNEQCSRTKNNSYCSFRRTKKASQLPSLVANTPKATKSNNSAH